MIISMHFQVENLPRDDDVVGLLHEIHSNNIVGHGYRGYSILGSSTPVREVAVSCITLVEQYSYHYNLYHQKWWCSCCVPQFYVYSLSSN